MVFNKVYFPADAISNHADFDGWYEDGERFMTVKSLNKENPWSEEADKIAIYSRLDAEMARIKPDHKTLSYSVRVERYTYTLQAQVMCPFLLLMKTQTKKMCVYA